MPANVPERSAAVFFVGAGLSSAFGIPNTQQLLDGVHRLAADPSSWAYRKDLHQSLENAYRYFYPIEGTAAGFRPSVVDFFSVLKTYVKVSAGLPGRLKGVDDLQSDLKRALANVLISGLRQADLELRRPQPELDRILQPGNYVITSNWDLLLERYCAHHQIPLRLTAAKPARSVNLLKLHGSIDWCLRDMAIKSITRLEYRSLGEKLFGDRPYAVDPSGDRVVRTAALERWSKAWQLIKSRAAEPLIITMALGKGDEIGPLGDTWRAAYGALSRAERLELIGYSVPADDIEIRTLIVSGLERGTGPTHVVVKNPSPEVHDRFRASIRREFESDYQPLSRA